MPYITQKERQHLDPEIDRLVRVIRNSVNEPGQMNYTISRIVSEVVAPETAPWKYDSIVQAVAAFECAKLEFYRRVAGPKENLAALQNGDILAYARPR